jgi:hypothetical protein
MKNKYKLGWVILMVTTICFSCKKFLEIRQDKETAAITSLNDLEGIIDNYLILNSQWGQTGEDCSDTYWLNDAGWGSTLEYEQNAYLWKKYENMITDWAVGYTKIYYSNVIIDNVDQFGPSDDQARNDRYKAVKGSAYFYRGYAHYWLAQVYCKPYEFSTSNADMGIPLRTSPDINIPSVRASVQDVYNLIINDLITAASMLPSRPLIKYHPSKPAAFGALARTYLAMQDYVKAGLYADSCLQLCDTLMDYNSISTTAAIPFVQWNPEVIFDCRLIGQGALNPSRAKIDTNLYKSYDVNDLRRTLFYKPNSDGSYALKGSYSGTSTATTFAGVASDEMYLIRAECFARNGNLSSALFDLNTLMRKRWRSGSFSNITATSSNEALKIILTERRKELIFRGLRWTDLRRLNKDPQFAITLTRIINGQTYTLLPNSDRYVNLIPLSVIQLTNMPQNP